MLVGGFKKNRHIVPKLPYHALHQATELTSILENLVTVFLSWTITIVIEAAPDPDPIDRGTSLLAPTLQLAVALPAAWMRGSALHVPPGLPSRRHPPPPTCSSDPDADPGRPQRWQMQEDFFILQSW